MKLEPAPAYNLLGLKGPITIQGAPPHKRPLVQDHFRQASKPKDNQQAEKKAIVDESVEKDSRV